MPYTFNPLSGAFDYYTVTPVSTTNTNFQDSFLVSGGQVTWVSGYQFRVSAASYYIGGTLYTSTQQNITLNAADATLDRIDVIALDTTSTVVKVTGTAASSPSEPTIDPGTQLKLAIVSVPHNTTQPSGAANTLIYDENVGAATEWNSSTSGSGFNANSTNNPNTGSKDTEGTTVAVGAYVQYQIGSGSFDPSTTTQLTFYLRSKAAWNKSSGLQIGLYSTGVLKGSVVKLSSGSFGFDSTNTTSYQLVAIPTAQFAVPVGTTITQIRFIEFGSAAIGFYLDTINWHNNGGASPTNYAPISSAFVTVGNDSTLTGERALTGTAGDITVTDNGANSTIVIDIGTNVITLTGTQTLTNKRNTKRVVTASDAASVTPNTDSADITYQLNTQATGTLTINNDTGTPTNGQSWVFKIKSTNVQTFSWGNVFVGGTVALPATSTGSSKIDYFSFIYDTVNSKWDYTGTATSF